VKFSHLDVLFESKELDLQNFDGVPKKKERPPPIENRKLIYGQTMLNCFLSKQKKFNSNCLNNQVNSNILLVTTSREVERIFGIKSLLLEKNPNYRILLIQAQIYIQAISSPREISNIVGKYSLRFNYFGKAREVIQKNITTHVIDGFYFDQLKEEIQKEEQNQERKQRKEMNEDIIKSFLVGEGFLKSDKSLTMEPLKKFLTQKKIKLNSNIRKEELIEKITPFVLAKVNIAPSKSVELLELPGQN